MEGHEPTCDCPDCQTRRTKCKHIWAVEYFVKQEIDSEGNQTITKAVRVTYGQDWGAYNKAQCNEQALFMKLLSDLCKNVPQPAYVFGRPAMPLSDMVFASNLGADKTTILYVVLIPISCSTVFILAPLFKPGINKKVRALI